MNDLPLNEPILTTHKPHVGRIVYRTNARPANPDILSLHSEIECRLRLSRCGQWPTPHFSIGSGAGGMAYPEVLRAYARLFNHAADIMDRIEPIDFQI